MKKNLLQLLFLVFSISYVNAQSEYKIEFNYDTAGNQILRDRVCVNCETTLKIAVDSTLVALLDKEKDLEEEIKKANGTKIIAYPNPVTDVLKVEWIAAENSVKQIVLFSLDNRQLFSKKINSDVKNIDVSFYGYPPGMYMLLVIYADNAKQSLQVIKK